MPDIDVERPTIIPHLVAGGMLLLAPASWPHKKPPDDGKVSRPKDGSWSVDEWTVLSGPPIFWIVRRAHRYWSRGQEGVGFFMTTPTKTVSGPKPDTQPTHRNCLKCDREFISEGPHNRLCLPCRGKLGIVERPWG